MKLAWGTDLHLNFVDHDKATELCRRIEADKPQAILLGGDIAESS